MNGETKHLYTWLHDGEVRSGRGRIDTPVQRRCTKPAQNQSRTDNGDKPDEPSEPLGQSPG